ncbi:MAG: class F sortase [Chloroflexi bacterium]|nr:class F sortase [Chloroflexota bacterium]
MKRRPFLHLTLASLGWLAAGASATTARAQVPLLVPVEIAIPRIGLVAPVVPVGLEPDGAMEAPSDPDTVGWFSLGAGLGGPGNAILAGHVDWGGRLRTFGLLNLLQPNDEVRVGVGGGLQITYRVEWSSLIDAEGAPVAEIFAQGAREEITLITCGGVFDPVTRSYLQRLLVRAVRIPADVATTA